MRRQASRGLPRRRLRRSSGWQDGRFGGVAGWHFGRLFGTETGVKGGQKGFQAEVETGSSGAAMRRRRDDGAAARRAGVVGLGLEPDVGSLEPVLEPVWNHQKVFEINLVTIGTTFLFYFVQREKRGKKKYVFYSA
jgi:hypothetical protein